MAVWPFPIPLNAWLGLATSAGELPPAHGYARQPITLEYTQDGVTVANSNTLQWPMATANWGTITDLVAYDAQSGGNLLFNAMLGTADTFGTGSFGSDLYGGVTVPLSINQYQRARLSAGSLAIIAAYVPRPYGTGRYGTYAYVTQPIAYGTALLLRTFDITYPCEAGAWVPFKCAA